MNIFSQVKQLKEMQSKLKKEEVTAEYNGVSITINGHMQIIDIKLNENLNIADQENAIQKAHQDAMKKIQQNLASSFKGLM